MHIQEILLHPHDREAPLAKPEMTVEVWHAANRVGVWARDTDPEVAAGAALIVDACNQKGLGGEALMRSLIDRLGDDDREWLARVAVEVQVTGTPIDGA